MLSETQEDKVEAASRSRAARGDDHAGGRADTKGVIPRDGADGPVLRGIMRALPAALVFWAVIALLFWWFV